MEPTAVLRPVEAFSIADAKVSGVDIYGIRDYVISETSECQDLHFVADDETHRHTQIILNTGFANIGDLEDGPVELTFPAKDAHAKNMKMIFTIPSVMHWKLFIHSGGYKKGWQFAYRGIVNSLYGTLDVVYVDDPAKTRHRISEKACPWPGTGSLDGFR
jgi:hypothetical protein